MSVHITKNQAQIEALANKCIENSNINPELYTIHNVKRGLRDLNGKGVLTGLTEISEIISKKVVDGVETPCEGELYYRGLNINDIVNGFTSGGRFGFEEVTYLLLFGKLPTADELDEFRHILVSRRKLPRNFVRDIVMKSPSEDIMNTLSRSVLSLYSYDDRANDVSIPNVLDQSLNLISLFPSMVVYAYQAKKYYIDKKSLVIHQSNPKLSTAENILHLLRDDSKFTELEAKVLDLALVLHAEHGGGNNSSFTMHVVTSSGTDTYSAVAASLSSLKGPKHGGANIKVVEMFDELKKEVTDWDDEEMIEAYLTKLLNKEAFDRAGLIYGMGHAVYSVSDPRAMVFKGYVERLSEEKGRSKEFRLYNNVEKIASRLIAQKRKIYKGVSANIDFYSGFCYRMLQLPEELYTPLFAIARISGWSAHRLEELINSGKIIRPAYMSIHEHIPYVQIEDRK